MALKLASWSIPYADKHYCLYDPVKREFAYNRDGEVRVFRSKPSARGTLSRIRNGKQKQYTCNGGQQ